MPAESLATMEQSPTIVADLTLSSSYVRTIAKQEEHVSMALLQNLSTNEIVITAEQRIVPMCTLAESLTLILNTKLGRMLHVTDCNLSV